MASTSAKVFLGAILGAGINGFIAGAATLILIMFFYKSNSGALIDPTVFYIPFLAIWGAVCGLIIGGLFLRLIQSILVSLGLTSCLCLFLTGGNLRNETSYVVILLLMMGGSSLVASFIVNRLINKEDETR